MDFENLEKIIEEYEDEQVIGTWGIYNVETKESEIKGDMIGRTVKIVKENGQISLKRIIYPDNDYSKGKEDY